MSSWHTCLVEAALKTPLHIGDRPLGFVARTLPFVPAHIPLMALVPAVVAHIGWPDKRVSYMRVQSFLERHARFTAFFIRDEETGSPLIPGAFHLGKIETHFINSRQGIAVDYADRSARDSHLFEIEAITPCLRTGFPTRLTGYFFWKSGREDDLEIDNRGFINGCSPQDLLVMCQWGGERSKGYGKLGAVSVEDRTKSAVIWENAQVASDGDAPVVTWPADKAAPFYLNFDPAISAETQGHILPLSGRLFDPERGSGQSAPVVSIVWDIGWQSGSARQLQLGVKTATHISDT